ncbi:aldo/keto reductase [Arthrobacter sp. B6]|uniref:aldo/keto reductase n=1 Tax=Arthrobacter sp. B6 TaxID=1570137 RepID=UPI000831CC14|nr:aldo/keto reductase [Arthrobacter sp. B6]
MKTRRIGARGPAVGALGLGCLNLTGQYGEPVGTATARAAVDAAIEHGMTLFDTADSYGTDHANELFVGEVIAGRRNEVTLSTKFGVVAMAENTADAIRGDRPYVKSSCEASLRRLGVDHIDLYYLHRPDPKVPIEETVGAMGELVEAGKVRWIGICEASAETIRRAHRTHELSAVQSEWSLFSRDIESEVIPVAKELGISVVPFAPLGRGFLTGAIASLADLPPDDSRRRMPRFQEENFNRNLEIVRIVREIAGEKGCSPAQIALAWLLAQGDHVVPIPGSDRPELVAENAASVELVLSQADLDRIEDLLPVGTTAGNRYWDMSWAEGQTPEVPK